MPVRRISNFRSACGASHGVRHDAGLHVTADARNDAEIVDLGFRSPFMAFDRIEPGKGGTCGTQPPDESLKCPNVAARVDQYAIAIVAYITDQPAIVREPPHRGPET